MTPRRNVITRRPKRVSRGEIIRRARLASGLSQRKLAARLGLAGRTLMRWEADENEPRGALAESLLEALAGIDPATYRELAGALGLADRAAARDAALEAALVRAGLLADAKPSALRAALAHVLTEAKAHGVPLEELLARLADAPAPARPV